MSTNVKMQGELEPGLLMDMLQVMNRRRSLNGYVEVSAASIKGRIWLHEGALIAADWKDRQGELAIESMLRLKQGLFEVCEVTALPARTICKDTVAVLMMCMRAIGREALTPAVPARNSSLPPETKAMVSAPVVAANQEDEPLPAPAHLPVERSRKRGFFTAAQWNWRIAASAVLLMALAGAGILFGTQFRGSQGEGCPVVAPAPVPVAAPQFVPAVAAAPAKPIPVLRDAWPEIMLSALAASGKRHYCAILNGQLLGVGEQVDGVTVRSIRANGVVLEYQGQRRFLCAIKQR